MASLYAETRLAAFRPERIVALSHGLARGSDGFLSGVRNGQDSCDATACQSSVMSQFTS